MKHSIRSIVACVVSLHSMSCGGKTESTPTPPPVVASCQDGWQLVTTPDQPGLAHQFLYKDGELYYVGTTGQDVQIVALPISGGDPRVITKGVAVADMWLEGDQILYAFNANLWQVSTSGGSPVQLITQDFDPNSIEPVQYEAVSPTSLYWVKVYHDAAWTEHTEIWSTLRDGSSQSSLFIDLSGVMHVQKLAIADNTLIVAGSDTTYSIVGIAYPLDGSARRNLASAGTDLLGVDAQGIYTSEHVTSTQFAMHKIPLDETPAQPFWPTMPDNTWPYNAWADGNRGWLVSASEQFDDGHTHLSFFFLDSRGTATRVACDPNTQQLTGVVADPAFTSDAAYLVVFEDSNAGDWQILKLNRP